MPCIIVVLSVGGARCGWSSAFGMRVSRGVGGVCVASHPCGGFIERILAMLAVLEVVLAVVRDKHNICVLATATFRMQGDHGTGTYVR